MDCDESLRNKQQEWVDLLNHEELSVDKVPCSSLPLQDKPTIAALWLNDGAKGRNIDYPQSSQELLCYKVSRSARFLAFYTAVCLLHISIPFIEQPYCAWTSSNGNYDYNSGSPDNSYLSLSGSGALEIFCLLVYFLELSMRLAVNYKEKNIWKIDSWTQIRFIVCCVLSLDCLVALCFYHPIRSARCLVPFVYITRRKSLRQIVQGLLKSTAKCVPVFTLLFTIILVWSYVGHLIFGNVRLDVSGRFGNLEESFSTTIESFAARSYLIFALDPYFQKEAGSAVFFVTLAILADVLCGALIVGAGNRQYRLYCSDVFHRQMINRKRAVLASFCMLHQFDSEVQGDKKSNHEEELHPVYDPAQDTRGFRIGRETWLKFCSKLKWKFRMCETLANIMFDSELSVEAVESDTESNHLGKLSGQRHFREEIDCESFFRLAALLDTRLRIESIEDDGNVIRESMRLTTTDTQSEPGISLTSVNGSDSMSQPHTPHDEKESQKLSLGSTMIDIAMKFSSFVQIVTQYKLFIRLPFRVPLLGAAFSLCVFEIVGTVMRFILSLQLWYANNITNQEGWAHVGYALEAYFWCEMLLLMVTSSPFSKTNLRLLTINVVTLGLMISTGRVEDEEESRDGPVVALSIFQCLRFYRIFTTLATTPVFSSMSPLLIRIVFIVFSVIYFFAAIGYYRLCDAFDSEEAAAGDDFATKWVPYQYQLNFNTMMQTMYTLFEVSLLGSWTMVMQAAAQDHPMRAITYFFAFRLFMSLVVWPILTSFIIQTYTVRSDKFYMEKELAMGVNVENMNKHSEESVVNSMHASDADAVGVCRQSVCSDLSSGSERSTSIGHFRLGRTSSTGKKASLSIDSSSTVIEDSMMSFWSGTGSEKYMAQKSSSSRGQKEKLTRNMVDEEVYHSLRMQLQSTLSQLEIEMEKNAKLINENHSLRNFINQELHIEIDDIDDGMGDD